MQSRDELVGFTILWPTGVFLRAAVNWRDSCWLHEDFGCIQDLVLVLSVLWRWFCGLLVELGGRLEHLLDLLVFPLSLRLFLLLLWVLLKRKEPCLGLQYFWVDLLRLRRRLYTLNGRRLAFLDLRSFWLWLWTFLFLPGIVIISLLTYCDLCLAFHYLKLTD